MTNTNKNAHYVERFDRPGFIVRNEEIVYSNTDACSVGLLPGISISPLVVCGLEYLDTLKDGDLCTATLRLPDDSIRQATVNRTGDEYLILLDSEEDERILQALALAAQKLRNPLQRIQFASSDLFKAIDIMDTTTRQHIRELQMSIFQILRLVDNMSDSHELMSCPMHNAERTDLEEFFSEIISTKVALLAEELELQFSFVAPRKAITANIDREKVARCVYNLLSNAMRFTPKNGHIRCELLRSSTHAIFQITDSGPGLKQEIREKLFSRYHRSPSLEDPRHGLGLGLLIARTIAKNHGGALYVTSCADGGTQVAFTLSRLDTPPNGVHSPTIMVSRNESWDQSLVELSGELPLSALRYMGL